MKKEIKIGLAGIAALTILFFGINYLKGVNMFKSEHYYYVDFTNINGLAQSSPVFVSGLKVGLVRDIQYNYQKPGHVVVGVELDSDMRIPQGSRAELVTEMLGTVKMNLLFNHSSATYHAPGDTIQGVVNEGIMAAAEKEILPQMNKMLPKLDSILVSLNNLLADSSLTRTLHNVEHITASLQGTSSKLDKLMTTDIPRLTGNAVQVTEDLKVISGNLKAVDFATTFSRVDETLQSVHELTTKLNRKDNSLGLLFNDSAFYNNLNRTAANAATLLKDLQEHPKRYVHFSLFGRKDK